MALTIFLVLDGMGVVFLLAVLANFWKEGHRPRNNGRKYAAEYRRRNWAEADVATHSISPSAQGSPSVIPFRTRGLHSDKRTTSCETSAASVRRISIR